MRFLLITFAGGVTGCSKQPQSQPPVVSIPTTAIKIAKNSSCPTISKGREAELRKAVRDKRAIVDKYLRFNPQMKNVKIHITADVDFDCKILNAPGVFVNIAGDYVPYDNPKQRDIVDGVVKKYGDKRVQIYNNIGNHRS